MADLALLMTQWDNKKRSEMRCCIKVKSACITGGHFLFVFVLLSASVKAPELVHGGFFFYNLNWKCSS